MVRVTTESGYSNSQVLSGQRVPKRQGWAQQSLSQVPHGFWSTQVPPPAASLIMEFRRSATHWGWANFNIDSLCLVGLLLKHLQCRPCQPLPQHLNSSEQPLQARLTAHEQARLTTQEQCAGPHEHSGSLCSCYHEGISGN